MARASEVTLLNGWFLEDELLSLGRKMSMRERRAAKRKSKKKISKLKPLNLHSDAQKVFFRHCLLQEML